MTKDELIYALGDILEREVNDWGICRWCGEEQQPVGDDEEPEEYCISHRSDCAVSYIEAVLKGDYKYVNPPTPRSCD